MCGRFTLSQTGEVLADAFELTDIPTASPRYNIAPTQPVGVVRASTSDGASEREFSYLIWGLVPSWSKDPKIGSRMINARAETVAEKPSFRTAFKRRRCLVVADGFYEWKRAEKGKQPHYFYLKDHRPFGFAGLWEHWEDGNGDVIESCTIITTEANGVLRPLHDRMPVILDPKSYDLWLDPTIQTDGKLHDLLHPYDEEAMASHPVSPVVNNPRHEDADCIQPLAG